MSHVDRGVALDSWDGGSSAPDPRAKRSFFGLPGSRYGKAAFLLWLLSFVLFGAGAVAAANGEKGGETFFSGSPWLYLTILPAFVAAIAAGVGAMWAVMRRGERSILVILPLVFGALTLVFAIGEIIGHE